LSAFLTPDGKVLQQFEKNTRAGNVKASRPYKVGEHCSSIRDALQKLETTDAHSDLSRRLRRLRRDIAERGVMADDTLAVTNDPMESDLYNLIQDHRNSNLHGGRHIVHIGLAALLLATIIAIAEISEEFDSHRSFAQIVVRVHAPLDPSGRWFHACFYPVNITSPTLDNPHRWTRWRTYRHPGGSLTTTEVVDFEA